MLHIQKKEKNVIHGLKSPVMKKLKKYEKNEQGWWISELLKLTTTKQVASQTPKDFNNTVKDTNSA